MTENEQPDFESVRNRLAEIAETVDDESLSLDDALDLYEEAVALGLQASDLLETGVVIPEEDPEAEESAQDDFVGAQSFAPGSPQANEDNAPTPDAPQPEDAPN